GVCHCVKSCNKNYCNSTTGGCCKPPRFHVLQPSGKCDCARSDTFGPACEQRCKCGDRPCHGGVNGTGACLCLDCQNGGLCDISTGHCMCVSRYSYGDACEISSAALALATWVFVAMFLVIIGAVTYRTVRVDDAQFSSSSSSDKLACSLPNVTAV